MTRARTPRRPLRAVAIGVVLATLLRAEPAPATAAGGDDLFDPALIALLGAMDFVPSRNHLEEVMGPSPVDELLEIIGIGAVDPASPGVRLRAVRALAQYPGEPARAALREVIGAYSAAQRGFDLLLLRAAIEGLAVIGGAAAVTDVAPFLEVEESRDLRATAAIALGVIGSPTASDLLSARFLREPTLQVKLAITEALRAIDED